MASKGTMTNPGRSVPLIGSKWLLQYIVLAALAMCSWGCVHDELIRTVTPAFYDDTTPRHKRLLQSTNSSANVGNLRIFADYSMLDSMQNSTVNLIKRMVNITSIYFYNILTVDRLDVLYYPANISNNCGGAAVPQKYTASGAPNADIGVLVINQKNNTAATYIAKSTSCVFLKSNNRPIWGMMSWNDLNLRYDPEGFQQVLYVAAHQLTHILGFSALLYDMYVGGSPLSSTPDGSNYFNSTRLREEVNSHFGCDKPLGLLLEDADGTLISSHWERKAVGSEYMTASNVKNSFMSRFTLALFESTGWYRSVNYDYAEPMLWGKNKGCAMLDSKNCDASPQFCSQTGFSCDFDGTGIGSCKADQFSNCKISKHFTNTICMDPAFPSKNLNKNLAALEVGGSSSKCFRSDLRAAGLDPSSLNFRCYTHQCSEDGSTIFVRIGNSVLACKQPSQVLAAPVGLIGTLTCPSDFSLYCNAKKACENHCNINGMCVNGQCLCTGNRELQESCLEVQLTVKQVGEAGGFLNAINSGQSELENSTVRSCFGGYALQAEFGECVSCVDLYNCKLCTDAGCSRCDDGSVPLTNGSCK